MSNNKGIFGHTIDNRATNIIQCSIIYGHTDMQSTKLLVQYDCNFVCKGAGQLEKSKRMSADVRHQLTSRTYRKCYFY